MNRAKKRLTFLALAVLAFGAACTESKDTEDYVPSDRGAVQPDAGGVLINELSACSELAAAEADAREALSCDAVERQCPEYIRPAGGEGCFEYSQASVKGCAALYDSFTSCDDFALHPCLISAVSNCASAGEGGAGGAPGAVGEAGSAGSVAAAGSAGLAGEGGVGG